MKNNEAIQIASYKSLTFSRCFFYSRNDYDKFTYPLNLAAKLGLKPIVTILLANGAELNSQDSFVEYTWAKKGSTPLIEATRGGFAEIMLQLISKGADINKMDELSPHLYRLGQFDRYGETALIVAAKERNLDYVKILVENGADLNIGLTNVCPDRSTALDFAKDSTPEDSDSDYYPDYYEELSYNNPTYDYLRDKGARHQLPRSTTICAWIRR